MEFVSRYPNVCHSVLPQPRIQKQTATFLWWEGFDTQPHISPRLTSSFYSLYCFYLLCFLVISQAASRQFFPLALIFTGKPEDRNSLHSPALGLLFEVQLLALVRPATSTSKLDITYSASATPKNELQVISIPSSPSRQVSPPVRIAHSSLVTSRTSASSAC
jgi:hypothetical protein